MPLRLRDPFPGRGLHREDLQFYYPKDTHIIDNSIFYCPNTINPGSFGPGGHPGLGPDQPGPDGQELGDHSLQGQRGQPFPAIEASGGLGPLPEPPGIPGREPRDPADQPLHQPRLGRPGPQQKERRHRQDGGERLAQGSPALRAHGLL